MMPNKLPLAVKKNRVREYFAGRVGTAGEDTILTTFGEGEAIVSSH